MAQDAMFLDLPRPPNSYEAYLNDRAFLMLHLHRLLLSLPFSNPRFLYRSSSLKPLLFVSDHLVPYFSEFLS